jgi:uncharacterized protein YbbC (DUF1343 family)
MTPDTVFDIASLTKVVATTPAVIQLVVQGKLKLDDPAGKYWPKFRTRKKDRITVRHLLTHYSGLRPSVPMKGKWNGYEAALKRVVEEKPDSPPGTQFCYSDTNFIVLGELVRRISGKPLDIYCRDHVFRKLGMKDTCFTPSPGLQGRIAPTWGNGRGEVHDPLARRMGGVAGHAGLFSTADDLAIYAQALLDGGRGETGDILSPAMVEKMILPESPPGKFPRRGLGWAVHSASGGEWSMLLPPGSYGHKGFTGTMVWIDPVSKTFLIVLSNRVYLSEKPGHETLRSQLFSLVAEAAGRAAPPPNPTLQAGAAVTAPREKVRTGLEVLAAQQFAPLAGLRVGLITNHTGVDSEGRRSIDLLHKARRVKLKAIFSPEHGLAGSLDRKIASTRDRKTRLPVYSLYGDTLRPTPKMLKGIDALIFDIQDSGTRFYTYISTMGFALEAASRKKISFYVLDRPNPITASLVQGPVLDQDLQSFTGYFPLPIRHGMTVGELAGMFNAENKIGAKLRVIPMSGYRRSDWLDETGLAWVNPSPNLRSLTQATLYPGVALVEGSNVSVGRGTPTPFELVGAPWIQGKELAEYLADRKIPGVEFKIVEFRPAAPPYENQTCTGVRVILTDRQALDSAALGIEIVKALFQLYPGNFELDKTLHLIGSRAVLQAIKEGRDPHSIQQSWQDSLDRFRQLRSRYLLYPE